MHALSLAADAVLELDLESVRVKGWTRLRLRLAAARNTLFDIQFLFFVFKNLLRLLFIIFISQDFGLV